jgi:MFS family permease
VEALPLERRIVRAGVCVLAVAALAVVVCSFLPGYRVTEVDSSDCVDRAFDLWGHGGGRDEPCVTTRRDLGTEPAGSPELVLATLLAMAPAWFVWRRGTARRAVAWGGLIWGAAILLFFVAIATYESDTSGCSGVYQERETLWPTIVLGWSAFAVFVGPMAIALVAAIARWRERRRLERERIPPATVL